MITLKQDEKTFTASYAAEGGYNALMEIEATKDGLQIDEHTTVPWGWVLKAHSVAQKESVQPDVCHRLVS